MEKGSAMKSFITFFVTVLSLIAHAKPLIKVRMDFVEALSPKDTTSSERFQKDFEGAISLSKRLLVKELAKCGYEIDSYTKFYDASDSLKAKEAASQSEKEGTWLLVGPRRSNHYLLFAQGTSDTPSVSLMAGANAVSKLAPRHLSLSPTNEALAASAAHELKAALGKGANYLTIVSDDCTNCVDFSKDFDSSAQKLGMKKLQELKVIGEEFDLTSIKQTIETLKPKAVILPNYSKVSSRIMSAVNTMKEPPLFIGGDGWGDNRYGFVQSGFQIENASGLTVRGFPPVENGLATFNTGKKALKEPHDLPFSGPSMGIIKIMEEVSGLLCKSRPKSKIEFTKAFEKILPRKLQAPWGVSVYGLKKGEISYLRKSRATK